MPDAIFFRLLGEPVDDKAAALAAHVSALNAGDSPDGVFSVSDRAFTQIPGSPFAYWAKPFFKLFKKYPKFDSDYRTAKRGPSTGDDFRRVRTWWEVLPQKIGRSILWVPFSKGGAYSPYHYDVHLLVAWDETRFTLLEFYGRPGREISTLESSSYFFRPGLTWSRRTTSGISLRAMPAGCIFADKGPALFVTDDNHVMLLGLLALTNSALFESLVKLQLGAASAAARSYEVGIIQSTPVPDQLDDRLIPLARRAHDLQRENFLHDETTHVFQRPALLTVPAESLADAAAALAEQSQARQSALAQAQAAIDDIVFDLYGLDAADRQLVMREMGAPVASGDDESGADADDPAGDDDEPTPSDDLPTQAQNLLMWCMGVAFGRWDVRKALDPSLLPPLPEPFDPLPRCAPGALMNADGLPADKPDVPADYPLPIAWAGVLLDDPAQENNPASLDVVARVRAVLTLLWGARADAVESELCAALSMRSLREYFRNPSKGFFNFHSKRYSKSRRKAPIYWLLQSERRTCAAWLYYPRLTENTLFLAENVVYDLLQRERLRLDEFKADLDRFEGAERKRRERATDTQARLVEDVGAFHKGVLRAANQQLPPDHNDGVLISIAPLHELVPWREAAAMWQELIRGKYAWSRMSAQMKQRGLLKA